MTLRPPAGIWTWRSTLLSLTALVVPTVLALLLADEGELTEVLSAGGTVLVSCGALASSCFLVLHSRLAGNDHTLWLGTALSAFSVVGLVRAGLSLTRPVEAMAPPEAVMAALVPLLAGLGLLLAVGRTSARLRPLGVGVPLVLLALAGQQVLRTVRPDIDPGLLPVVCVVYCGVIGVLVAVVHQFDSLPLWARDRFGAGIGLAAGSSVVVVVARPLGGHLPAVASVVLALTGALLLTSTAAALVREVVADSRDQLHDLRHRLADVESRRRADQARLHDVHSLVAAIASASHLVRDLAPSPQRAGLEDLLVTEVDRLQRLLADRAPASRVAAAEIDLDQLLHHLALSHRARGRTVTTPVTGLRVAGDPDDLARLLDILVDNAARHGSPDDIELSACRAGADVAISVADGGPGVAPELRRSLFGWGTHALGSSGQGIGLHTAQSLATRLHGTLRLEDSSRGARFTLRLPDPSPSAPSEEKDPSVATR